MDYKTIAALSLVLLGMFGVIVLAFWLMFKETTPNDKEIQKGEGNIDQ